MKIGIIGASLAGLTAGKKLAIAGHDVTIIEKNRSLGGRLATFDSGDGNIFDFGYSHFDLQGAEFKSFAAYLKEEKLIDEWTSRFEFYDGIQLHEVNPNRSSRIYYAAPKGMQAIAENLGRWVDVKSREKAGGLTYIGSNRTNKRPWMINLTDISVFECDAVIIAAPAPEAHGLLSTSQDEIGVRNIIRYVDKIYYKSGYAVMATYDEPKPDWKAIECKDDRLEWVVNESSKRKTKNTSLVFHSSSEFAKSHAPAEPDAKNIVNLILERGAEITGENWLRKPQWNGLHYWKYNECKNPINERFFEMESYDAPLAVIGDYLGGNSFESAYLSGLKLAEYWIQKYEIAEIER